MAPVWGGARALTCFLVCVAVVYLAILRGRELDGGGHENVAGHKDLAPQSNATPRVLPKLTSEELGGIENAHRLASKLLNLTLQLPEHRYPRSWLYGWAARTLLVSHQDKVAYLLMPKAGSSSIRGSLIRDFHVKQNRKVVPRLAAVVDAHRFVVHKRSTNLEWLRSYYTFTYVNDPVSHFVAGICEVNRRKCSYAVQSQKVEAQLAHNFERRGIHIAAALKGEHTGDLNEHLAPQLFVLRAAGSVGIKVNFLARLSHDNWKLMRADMVSRGYSEPGKLPLKNALSFSTLKRAVFAALTPSTREAVCDFIREEYSVLEIPMDRDNVCFAPANRSGTARMARRLRRGKR